MRIAVSAQGEDLNSEVDPRFGRAARFLLIDTETMAFEVVENTRNLQLPQGAGIQAAQNVAQHNPQVVLTGNCGPKAFKVLLAAGVDVAVGAEGKIRDAVQAFLDGRLRKAEAANVRGHWT